MLRLLYPLRRTGKIRNIGVTTGKHSAANERERINSVMRSVLRQPDIKEKRLTVGVEAADVTAEPFDKRVRAELVKWEKLLKPLGITVE